jgi:hypothetical protein
MNVENKPASLYHYTSFENFLSIMDSMELRFSSIDRVNDLSEKMIRSQKTFNRVDVEKYLLKNCKMLSFTSDSQNHQRMWAQYAPEGVCIEIRSSDFIEANKEVLEKYGIIANEIEYVRQSEKQEIEDDKIPGYINDFEMEDFVSRHLKEFIFTKDKDWENEKEYRFIAFTQEKITLSISSAFEEVYINEKAFDRLYKLQDLLKQKKGAITPLNVKKFFWRLNSASHIDFSKDFCDELSRICEQQRIVL